MLTDREGLLRSATLLAIEAVRGTDEEVALTVRTAVGEDRFCDTLEALSNKYDGKEVELAAQCFAAAAEHVEENRRMQTEAEAKIADGLVAAPRDVYDKRRKNEPRKRVTPMINEKLAKFARMNVVARPSRRGGRGPGADTALITLSKPKGAAKEKQLTVSLHERAVRSLGWQLGDRIAMHVGAEGEIVLCRDQTGRRLSSTNSKEVKARRRLVFPVVPEFYDAVSTGCGLRVEIAEGRIAFEMPPVNDPAGDPTDGLADDTADDGLATKE